MSVRTAYKWLARHRAGGEPALPDRSSAPARSPRGLPADVIAEIERLRRQRLTGLQIARRLGRSTSTIGLALRRLGLGRLAALEPRPAVIPLPARQPGELVHIDTKKLGRIDGVGHRLIGDRTGRRRHSGWEILHVAIDDAARLAYSEILPDERRCAASLAPIARDSGQRSGNRFICGGRAHLRQTLYMPALVAVCFNAAMKAKYDAVRAACKPPKVALTAIMRKLIILANALIRDSRMWSPSPA